jgi:hypothetical protein
MANTHQFNGTTNSFVHAPKLISRFTSDYQIRFSSGKVRVLEGVKREVWKINEEDIICLPQVSVDQITAALLQDAQDSK